MDEKPLLYDDPFVRDLRWKKLDGTITTRRYDAVMDMMDRGFSDERICRMFKYMNKKSDQVSVAPIEVYRLAHDGKNTIIENSDDDGGASRRDKASSRWGKIIREIMGG